MPARTPSAARHDELVPDPAVCREFSITSMTLWRWDRDQELNFPPAIKIRSRNFRSRRLIEEFKARMLSAAIEQRDQRRGAKAEA